MENLDLSNKGYFDGIPCGVLSEDGVYNLLFDHLNLCKSTERTSGYAWSNKIFKKCQVFS